MASSDISPVRGSSSSSSSSLSSSSKLKQKKLAFFKKKKIPGPAKKRVARRAPPRNLTCKKTSPVNSKYLKTVREAIDNTRKQTIDKTRKQGIDNTRMSQQGGSICSQVEINSPAMDRAKEVQSKLPPEYPSFVKYMLKSHVSGGFWLGLPKSFCYMHMPKRDETFLLVGGDEDAEEHKAKYLVEKSGLSGGWRGFSLLHNLVEGDVLVFQLIESLKFKVYIIRASERAEIDGAMGLLDLNTHAKPLDNNIGAHNEKEVENVENVVEMVTTDNYLKPCETGIRQKDGTRNGSDSEPVPTLEQTGNRIDELKSQDPEGVRSAKKSVYEFKDVKGFESFNVLVDGLIIDAEIPIHLRYKYYELCRNQKSFLHDDLVKGLNIKLAAGIICETVNIADSIKAAAKVTSVSLEHVVLQSWDKTLKAFEDMGMRVGFLRTCLNKIVCLSYEQHEIIRSKKTEQARLEEEIRGLESKLLKSCEVKRTLDAEIVALMTKDLSVQITF